MIRFFASNSVESAYRAELLTVLAWFRHSGGQNRKHLGAGGWAGENERGGVAYAIQRQSYQETPCLNGQEQSTIYLQ